MSASQTSPGTTNTSGPEPSCPSLSSATWPLICTICPSPCRATWENAPKGCHRVGGLIASASVTLADIVIRADLDGNPSGRELVARVREAVLGAFAHQDLPFERLVDALDLERDPRWSPLFQVSFILHNAPREEPRLPGLAVELLDTGTGTVQFDLVVSLSENAGTGGAAGVAADAGRGSLGDRHSTASRRTALKTRGDPHRPHRCPVPTPDSS